MTIHVTGSDLAAIYAAGLSASSPTMDPVNRTFEAGEYVRSFLSLLTEIDGKPPHVGDPFVWESGTDSFPNRIIDQ